MIQDARQKKWMNNIAQWLQSGKSARAWCRENKVVYTTFLGWHHRLKCDSSSTVSLTTDSALPFIELKEKPTTSSGVSIECSGILIHLASEFSSATLKKCLDVIRGGTC